MTAGRGAAGPTRGAPSARALRLRSYERSGHRKRSVNSAIGALSILVGGEHDEPLQGIPGAYPWASTGPRAPQIHGR